MVQFVPQKIYMTIRVMEPPAVPVRTVVMAVLVVDWSRVITAGV